MATDFPGGLQDFSVVATGNNITASNHNTIQDTIEALEAKVGITSSGESSSIDYLIKSESSKLGKIASLAVSDNYIVGTGGMAATWGVKSASEVVTDLGLVIGTDVQAYSNKLDSLTSTVPAAADKYVQYDSGNYAGITTVEVRADLFTLGSDATGDVFYRDASGILARLGVGTAGYVLTLAGDPALPTWAAGGGGAGPDFTEAVTITADDDSNPLLTITQSGTANILDLIGTNTSFFKVDKDGRIDAYFDDGTEGVPASGTFFKFNGDTDNGSPLILDVQADGSSKLKVHESSGWRLTVTGHMTVTGTSGFKDITLTQSISTLGTPEFIVDTGVDRTLLFKHSSVANQLGYTFDGGRKGTVDEVFFDLSPTFAKTTSGNYTAFKLNVTESGTQAGSANLLMDLQVDGNTVFNIDPDGVFAINSSTPALTIDQSGAGDNLHLLEDGDERIGFDTSGIAAIHFNRGDSYSYPLLIEQVSADDVAYIGIGGLRQITINAAGLACAGNLNVTGTLSVGSTSKTVFQGDFETYEDLIALNEIRYHGQPAAYGKGAYCNFKNIREYTEIAASAASTTTTMQIPAGAVVFGVSVRVGVTIPTVDSFDVGVSGDTDRFGAGIDPDITTTNSGESNVYSYHPSAEGVVLTMNGTPPDDGDGRVRVDIWYLSITPPTSNG